MSEEFDFISATDKPALLAFSTPEWLEIAKASLIEWVTRSIPPPHTRLRNTLQPDSLPGGVIEECFAANSRRINSTLQLINKCRSQRRHSTIILFALPLKLLPLAGL